MTALSFTQAGGVVVELSRGVVERTKLLGGVLQEVVAGVQLGAGGTASHKGDGLDVVGSNDLGDDVLHVGKVNGVMHFVQILSCVATIS